jgi:putative metallohydrolase (TIGR04338 family)
MYDDAQLDPQQDRVYESELVLLEGRDFASIEELMRYISEVVHTRWMRNRGWNFYRLEVRDGCGSQARCRVDNGACTLIFPRGTRNQLTVMHELACAVTFDRPGPNFRAMYIGCVRRFMGPEYAAVIRRGLVVRRVKH